jgi:transcriptional regulator with XRE-family HTH domain
MKEHGWDIKTFAGKLGASHDAVYRWLRGDRQPRVEFYMKMLNVFKLKKMEDLMVEESKDGI